MVALVGSSWWSAIALGYCQPAQKIEIPMLNTALQSLPPVSKFRLGLRTDRTDRTEPAEHEFHVSSLHSMCCCDVLRQAVASNHTGAFPPQLHQLRLT